METNNKRTQNTEKISSTVGFSVAGLLFLLLYSYVEFLGLIYLTKGDSVLSILVTGTLAILLIIFSFALPHIKSSNSAFVSKRRKKLSIIFFCLFLISSLCSFVGVSHFFKIQKNEDTIQNLYNSAIKEAQEIYPAYSTYAKIRLVKYDKVLKNAVSNKWGDPAGYRKKIGIFPGDNDKIKNDILLKSLKRTLLPSNDTIQVTFDKWLKTVGGANVWNVSFVYNLQILDSRVQQYIDKLHNLSGMFYHPGEETIPFQYPEYKSNNEINKYFEFEGIYYSNRALFSWLITMFALIMPWFRDIRSRKDL